MTGTISRISSFPEKNGQAYRIRLPAVNVIVFAPLVIIISAFIVWGMPNTRRFTRWILQENHPVEILTFLSLFAAGFMGLQLAWMARQRGKGILIAGFYALFSVGLLFVAMEEISWGQWFFGFDTPSAIRAVNRQRELNLHNIPGFHAPFEILRVAFGVGGLIGVWFFFLPRTRDIGAPAILSLWFVIIAMLAALDLHNYYVPLQRFSYRGDSVFVIAARMVEVLELLIGLSAFLYMWLNGRKFSREWNKVNT